MPSEKNKDMENKPPTTLMRNDEEFDKSREKILAMADYVVPGHDDMFKVQK